MMNSLSLIVTSSPVSWLLATLLVGTVCAGMLSAILSSSNKKLHERVKRARMLDGALEV